MKLITTIVRPERLPEVKAALFRAGITGITLSRVSGDGGEQEIVEQYRGTTVVMEFHEKVKIEMACSEPFVQPCIDAILSSARTGEVGDGKIFVHPVERVIRIRTGEVDNAALTAVNADEVQRRALGDVAALTSLLPPAPRVPYTPARRGVAARRIEPYDTRGGGPGLWPEPRLACRATLPLCTRPT